MIDLTVPMGAAFSPDGRYRYALWRIWDPLVPPLLFIGLNPSTADATMNDATITRLIHRAMKDAFLGRRAYGGLLTGNLFAYVSTNPKALRGDFDTVGAETDDYLREMMRLAGRTLVGWGTFLEAKKRAPAVLEMVKEPYCLGCNPDGSPKHPLYISYDTEMIPMEKGISDVKHPFQEKQN